MKHYRKWSHTIYDLKIHLVFVPKYRKRVLHGKIAKELKKYIVQICNDLDIEIIRWKLAFDHVHMFISYPPTLSVSKIAQKVKGKSSYKMMNNNVEVRKIFRWKHFRARWYLAVSSWAITDEMIQEYIDNQEGHDIADDNFDIEEDMCPVT